MYDKKTRTKYLLKFKPPSSCKLIFNEEVKERALRTFFYYLRNNGGGLPTKFIFTAYDYFILFKFKECKAKIDNGTLVPRPLYKGKQLNEGELKTFITDLARDIRPS